MHVYVYIVAYIHRTLYFIRCTNIQLCKLFFILTKITSDYFHYICLSLSYVFQFVHILINYFRQGHKSVPEHVQTRFPYKETW